MMPSQHRSVMLEQAVQWWGGFEHSAEASVAGCFVDGTFGRGGHTRLLLQALASTGAVLGLDKDPEAIAVGHALVAEEARFKIQQGSFADMQAHCAQLNWPSVDGVLLDLGVSSPQLDAAERGFSFMRDGPLDMRMDPSSSPSAAQWVNTSPEATLADVFFQYGEERFARRIAKAIVKRRAVVPFAGTADLAAVVSAAHPRWEKHKHPATRVFQAIRIEVNQELRDLAEGLVAALNILKPGGRLVVISFHSLEDRIVKRFMRLHAQGLQVPREIPLMNDQVQSLLRILVKGERPTAAEVSANPRARSSILRVAEKQSLAAGHA